VKLQHSLARTLVTARTWPVLTDLGVGACCLALLMAIFHMAAYWLSSPVPGVAISLSASALPLYAFLLRRADLHRLPAQPHLRCRLWLPCRVQPRVEAGMIAVLDILQSIPVLSFLPGVMLAMMALIPRHQLA